MLPQFTKPTGFDINEHFDLDNFNDPTKYKVIFESDPANAPEYLKDLPREYDESITKPLHMQEKTTTNPKENMFMAAAFRN